MIGYVLPDNIRQLLPTPAPQPHPTGLPLADLKAAPHLFQFRSVVLIERHVGELMSVLRRGDPLDPITVWFSHPGPIVIEGHHRLEAYHRAEWKDPIPVTVFEGTFGEALQYAAYENSKAKQPLERSERINAAWVIVATSPDLPQRAVTRATSVSLGTVNSMFQVAETLKDKRIKPIDVRTWAEARRLAKGEHEPLDHGDEWQEQLAQEWCERLGAAFGTKAQSQPEIFARALELYFARQLPQLVLALPRVELEPEEEELL
ncbi:MAG: ParB-like nuclease domain-containing protein [Salinarimonas sp.]|nr:ParB-like nuclease domain-containing protein [Salinarimonas sp.]